MGINVQVLVDIATFDDIQLSVDGFQDELFNLIVTQQQNLYFKNGDSLIGRVTKPEREFAEGSAGGFKEIAHGAATTILALNIFVNFAADVAVNQSNDTVEKQTIEEVKKEVVDKLNTGKHFIQGWLIVYELVDGVIKASKKKVDGQTEASKRKGE